MRTIISRLILHRLRAGQFVHSRAFGRACLLALVLGLAATAHLSVSAQTANAAGDESARSIPSDSAQVSDSAAVPRTDAATIMRHAKLIYVRKKSVYFKAPELENELRKRPEFERWGLMITRNEQDADLIIEVGRKVFTTRFIYTVLDPRTNIVVTSGKLSSLGGTLSTKIAKRFIEQMRKARES